MAFEKRGPKAPQDLRQPPQVGMAGANTVLLNDGFGQAALRRDASGAFSSNSEGRSAAPSARSGGLDDVDGSPDDGGYIHIRRIEQVRVRGGF